MLQIGLSFGCTKVIYLFLILTGLTRLRRSTFPRVQTCATEKARSTRRCDSPYQTDSRWRHTRYRQRLRVLFPSKRVLALMPVIEDEYEAFCDFARTAPTIDIRLNVVASDAPGGSVSTPHHVQVHNMFRDTSFRQD